MRDSDEDHRAGRTSLPASASRRGDGTLLAGLREEDDAVLRHGKARLRRERRPGLLLGLPVPASRDIEPEPAGELAGRAGIDPAGEERPLPPVRSRGVSGKIVGLTLVGALAGAAVAFAWPQSYVAVSEVLIDPREAPAAANGSSLSPDAALALVDNQLRVLRSGTMLGATAERLNLQADAEFNGAPAGLFGLRDLFAGDGAGAVERRRRHAVTSLGKAVQVGRSGSSSVVTVSAASGDPLKSALIANTLSELFVEGAGRQPGGAAGRLAELRAGVAEAERAIETFRAQNELVDADGRLITDEEILRLGEQLSAARARTVELNARAASTRDANVDSIVTGSLPEQYASPALSDLRSRHAAAKQQLDRLSARLGPRHPERLAAEAELESTRGEITAEMRRVASSLQTELTRAVQQEQELASQLARMKVRQGDIGGEMVRLRELERDAETRRSAYDRAVLAAQAEGPAPGGASIISRAEPPLEASGPSMTAFSLAGALAGLLVGLGLAGWRAPRRETEDEAETDDRPVEAAPHDTDAEPQSTGEEDKMYPYPPYAQQPAQAQPSPAGGHPHYPQQATPAQPPVMQPPMMQPAMMPQPAWPAAHYPAPPAAYPHWQAAPQQPAMLHDPWAHLRAYAPQPYAPPVQTVVYVPAPQQAHAAPPMAEAPAQPVSRHAPPSRPAGDRWHDQDAFVDEHTNAAIEEIRQSLREFREAIEDLADERHRHAERRYGT